MCECGSGVMHRTLRLALVRSGKRRACVHTVMPLHSFPLTQSHQVAVGGGWRAFVIYSVIHLSCSSVSIGVSCRNACVVVEVANQSINAPQDRARLDEPVCTV